MTSQFEKWHAACRALDDARKQVSDAGEPCRHVVSYRARRLADLVNYVFRSRGCQDTK